MVLVKAAECVGAFFARLDLVPAPMILWLHMKKKFSSPWSKGHHIWWSKHQHSPVLWGPSSLFQANLHTARPAELTICCTLLKQQIKSICSTRQSSDDWELRQSSWGTSNAKAECIFSIKDDPVYLKPVTVDEMESHKKSHTLIPPSHPSYTVQKQIITAHWLGLWHIQPIINKCTIKIIFKLPFVILNRHIMLL